ncbi:MAG: YdgA family protein [Gammaproteobacteria bacterium]|nr:YdgA family protein [Gammaproteobacteria bacterium]
MNRLALAAGIVLLALGVTPWVFGQMTAQRVNADIERANAEGEVDIEVIDYARGYRTSTATIEVGVPAETIEQLEIPDNLPVDAEVTRTFLGEPQRFVIEMTHGPIVGGDIGLMTSAVRLDPQTPGYQDLLTELDIPYLFETRTVTGFGGGTDFVTEMPPFSLMRDDLLVEFSGLDAAGSYDLIARRFDVDGGIDSLHVDSPTAGLVLEGLAFDSDSTSYNDVLRLGTVGATLARLSIISAGDGPAEGLEMNGLEVRFDIDLDETTKRAILTSVYRAASVSDGADINLTGLDVVANANDIDLDAFTTYYSAAQANAMQPDSVAPLNLEVEDALYALLAAGPTAEIGPVSFNWNDEPFTATLRILVDTAALPPRDSFTILTLMFGGAVAIELSLELSEPLASLLATRGVAFQIRRGAAEQGMEISTEDAEAMAASRAAIALAGLVAQGMLNSTDVGFASEARFSSGTLTVNGSIVPLGIP